jgi:hypothetical protein
VQTKNFCTARIASISDRFFILTNIGVTTSFYAIVTPLLLVGAGMGIFASPNRASTMSSVPSDRREVCQQELVPHSLGQETHSVLV